MSVLEQGFSAAASWLADDFLRKGLMKGNKGKYSWAPDYSEFLWMKNLEYPSKYWACLGLFCGGPMVLLQYLYAAVMQVVYNG